MYEADISNKQALEQIGFREITHALISVGDSISTSAMTTMYLKEMKVPNVWVKAINDDHAALLRKIGADEVIIPEHIAAAQLADRIHIPGIIDRLPLDPDMIIREMSIDQLTGKNLQGYRFDQPLQLPDHRHPQTGRIPLPLHPPSRRHPDRRGQHHRHRQERSALRRSFPDVHRHHHACGIRSGVWLHRGGRCLCHKGFILRGKNHLCGRRSWGVYGGIVVPLRQGCVNAHYS